MMAAEQNKKKVKVGMISLGCAKKPGGRRNADGFARGKRV